MPQGMLLREGAGLHADALQHFPGELLQPSEHPERLSNQLRRAGPQN